MAGSNRDEGVQPLTIPCTLLAIRLVAWVLVFTAFVLSAVAVKSCRFVRADVINYGGNASDLSAGISISTYRFGLYRFDYNGVCVSYGDAYGNLFGFQGSMSSARAMGALTPLLGGMAMVAALASFFVPVRVALWRVVGGVLSLCVILQGLTFVAFDTSLCDSEYYGGGVSATCKVDEGSKVAIASMVMHAIAAMAVFRTPAPDKPLIKFETMGGDEAPTTRARIISEPSTCNLTRDEVGKPRSDTGTAASDAAACPDDEQERYITATLNSDGSRTLVVKNGLPSEDRSGRATIASEV